MQTTIEILAADNHRGRRIRHPWPTQAAEGRALQQTLAQYVDLSPSQTPIQRIAGVDVGFQKRGRLTRAVAILIDAESGEFTDSARVVTATRMPYIPGLLSFREIPAILDALAALPIHPDLLMVDGQGIAHPRGVGTATHLGLATGLPSIGVAKSRLIGEYQPPERTGESTTLFVDDRPIGHVLKTRDRAHPIFISPGNRIDNASALAWVNRTLAGYRLPEPTRLADALSRDPKPDKRKSGQTRC